MSLFGLFRTPRAAIVEAETGSDTDEPQSVSNSTLPESATPCSINQSGSWKSPRSNGANARTPSKKGRRKRKAKASPTTATAVQKRRKILPIGERVHQNEQHASLATPQQRAGMANTYTPPTNGFWFNKFRRLSMSLRADPVQVKQEVTDDVEIHDVISHAPLDHPIKTVEKDNEKGSDSDAVAEDSIVVIRRQNLVIKPNDGNNNDGNDGNDGNDNGSNNENENENDNGGNDNNDDNDNNDANDDSDDNDSGLYMVDQKAPSNKDPVPADEINSRTAPTPETVSDGDNDGETGYDDSDDDEFNDSTNMDTVEEDWEWLFEEEPLADAATAASDAWSVDEDELTAYEEGVEKVAGYHDKWTADERRVHRLLALRGFHPLLPGTWTRDFLGVPMYPSLFAPLGDETHEARPTIIFNYGSQFHATKALRALFDLQARVSGLRQTGHNTARIGAIIERELRRYIAWAAADAGLDECGPLAAMPNIAAKQFLVGEADSRGRRKPLDRRVQEFFGDWVARYRSYYATLPEYEVEGSNGKEKRRLRPPRLLYGFVIVQHAVMLLVVDAASPENSGYDRITIPTALGPIRKKRRRQPNPRCLADFNLSLGDRWLDASLNVAIPVHVARGAQLRCKQGLVLPSTRVDAVDDDA